MSEIEAARNATTELRDAAREGRTIHFRQRDPLVAVIHAAIDKAETADNLAEQVASLTAQVETLRQQIARTCGAQRCACGHFACQHDGVWGCDDCDCRDFTEPVAALLPAEGRTQP